MFSAVISQLDALFTVSHCQYVHMGYEGLVFICCHITYHLMSHHIQRSSITSINCLTVTPARSRSWNNPEHVYEYTNKSIPAKEKKRKVSNTLCCFDFLGVNYHYHFFETTYLLGKKAGWVSIFQHTHPLLLGWCLFCYFDNVCMRIMHGTADHNSRMRHLCWPWSTPLYCTPISKSNGTLFWLHISMS